MGRRKKENKIGYNDKGQHIDFTSSSWSFLRKELFEIAKEVNADINVGLEDATIYLTDKLEDATPKKSGNTKAAWEMTLNYNNVKYINNLATNDNNVPIVNVLEFSAQKGHPFVRKTLKANENQLAQIIESSVKGDE